MIRRTGEINMKNIPSYVEKMNEVEANMRVFAHGRKQKIDLPINRDAFLNDGLIEWSVGYGKENTTSTFTRAEYVEGMQKVIANASSGGIKTSGLPEGTANRIGIQNAFSLDHILGIKSPRAGQKVSMLFHCLAKYRRAKKSAAKKQANADALAVAQTTKTSVTFDVVPLGEKKKAKAHSEHAGVKQAIRAYCRVKWGSDWHADATLKPTRMAEATKALYNPNL